MSEHPSEHARDLVPSPAVKAPASSKLHAAARARYIKTYGETLSHSKAIRAAGIGTRQAWTDLRKRDENFVEQLETAAAAVDDSLTEAAILRGRDGVKETVVQRGKIVYKTVIDPSGKKHKVPLQVTKYSDALLLALLKARKIEGFDFNAKQDITVTNKSGDDRDQNRVYLTVDDVRHADEQLRADLLSVMERLGANRRAATQALIEQSQTVDAEFSVVTEKEEWEMIAEAQAQEGEANG